MSEASAVETSASNDGIHLDLPDSYDFSVDGPISAGVTSVRFGSYFDAPIPEGAFPNGIKKIDFGWYFSQEINDRNIPESVETLVFGCWFQQPMEGLSLRNLKKISVHCRFCAVVPPNLLPVMPEFYQGKYESYKKLLPEFYDECLKLDDSLLPPIDPFSKDETDDTDNDTDTNDVKDENERKSEKDEDSECEEEVVLEGVTVHCRPSLFRASIHRCTILFICKHLYEYFAQESDLTLDGISCELNKHNRNQLVVTVSHSYWEWTQSVFVGRDNTFFLVHQGSGSVPKPGPPEIRGTRVGPLSIEDFGKSSKW